MYKTISILIIIVILAAGAYVLINDPDSEQKKQDKPDNSTDTNPYKVPPWIPVLGDINI